MERKRRERINNSLEQLAMLLKEANLVAKDKPVAKLEKADILELTVRYLRQTPRGDGHQPSEDTGDKDSSSDEDQRQKDVVMETKESLPLASNISSSNSLLCEESSSDYKNSASFEEGNLVIDETPISNSEEEEEEDNDYKKGFIKCLSEVKEATETMEDFKYLRERLISQLETAAKNCPQNIDQIKSIETLPRGTKRGNCEISNHENPSTLSKRTKVQNTTMTNDCIKDQENSVSGFTLVPMRLADGNVAFLLQGNSKPPSPELNENIKLMNDNFENDNLPSSRKNISENTLCEKSRQQISASIAQNKLTIPASWTKPIDIAKKIVNQNGESNSLQTSHPVLSALHSQNQVILPKKPLQRHLEQNPNNISAYKFNAKGTTGVIRSAKIIPRVKTVTLPVGTGTLPVGTSALPVGTGALPVGTRALPVGTSTLPVGTRALPVGTSALPVGTGALSVGTGACSSLSNNVSGITSSKSTTATNSMQFISNVPSTSIILPNSFNYNSPLNVSNIDSSLASLNHNKFVHIVKTNQSFTNIENSTKQGAVPITFNPNYNLPIINDNKVSQLPVVQNTPILYTPINTYNSPVSSVLQSQSQHNKSMPTTLNSSSPLILSESSPHHDLVVHSSCPKVNNQTITIYPPSPPPSVSLSVDQWTPNSPPYDSQSYASSTQQTYTVLSSPIPSYSSEPNVLLPSHNAPHPQQSSNNLYPRSSSSVPVMSTSLGEHHLGGHKGFNNSTRYHRNGGVHYNLVDQAQEDEFIDVENDPNDVPRPRLNGTLYKDIDRRTFHQRAILGDMEDEINGDVWRPW